MKAGDIELPKYNADKEIMGYIKCHNLKYGVHTYIKLTDCSLDLGGSMICICSVPGSICM